MKLSELVEGWPEEMIEGLSNNALAEHGIRMHNEARTACDKEVMVDEGEIVKIIKKHKEEQREDGDFKKCCGRIYVDPYTLAKSIAQNIKGIIKEVK